MRYDFIEIGTCDFDTLLESCKDWEHGISIEAIPEYLDNLPERDNVIKINAVISDVSKVNKIYTLSDEAIRENGLPDWVRGCSKLGSPHPYVISELRKRGLEHIYEERGVKTITFKEIIEEYSVDEIGTLKTDIEGNDISVINHLLDYGKVLPDRIIFEHNDEHNQESKQQDFLRLTERLNSMGYKKDSEMPGGNFVYSKKFSISLVSMYNEGYSKMADLTIRDNFNEYCQIHGYDLVDFKIDNEFLEGRDPQWGKIKLLRKLLEEGQSDWYFFIDCDCLIMNPSIKLEEFIRNDKFIILPKGGGSPDNPLTESCYDDNIMSSQILIKRSQKSIEFLDEIWESPDWPDNMDINEFDHEMRQMRISYRKEKWHGGMELVEEKRLNRFWPTKNPFMVDAFPHMNKNLWEPGDFIAHICSYQTNERVEIIQLLKNFVGGFIGKWEVSGNKIYMKPLVENIGDISLKLERDRNSILSWEIKSPNMKLIYWIAVDDLKSGDVVKVFNKDGIQISSYLINL
jgi:hypothetical protein